MLCLKTVVNKRGVVLVSDNVAVLAQTNLIVLTEVSAVA